MCEKMYILTNSFAFSHLMGYLWVPFPYLPPSPLPPSLPLSHSQCQVPQSPQTGGVAIVVTDDDGGIEGLEVQDHDGVRVEPRLRLQDQWQTLRSRHPGEERGGATIRSANSYIRTPRQLTQE